VTTTGATLDAAAAALTEARPVSIWGLAVARPDPCDFGDLASDPALEAEHQPRGRNV
jgi:hypothetical protein